MARTRRIVKTDDHVVGWTPTALPRFEAVRRGWRRGVGEVKGALTWHEVRCGEVDVGIGVQERGAVMVEYGAVKHERPLRLWLLAMFRNVGPPEEVDPAQRTEDETVPTGSGLELIERSQYGVSSLALPSASGTVAWSMTKSDLPSFCVNLLAR